MDDVLTFGVQVQLWIQEGQAAADTLVAIPAPHPVQDGLQVVLLVPQILVPNPHLDGGTDTLFPEAGPYALAQGQEGNLDIVITDQVPGRRGVGM